MLSPAILPRGERFGSDTLLGLSLAAACIFPTQIVFVLAFFALGAVLWGRSFEDFDENLAWQFPRFGLGFSVFTIFLFLAGSTFMSVVPKKSAYSLVIWMVYGAFFFAAYDLGYRKCADRFFWPVFTGATLASLSAIYQKVSGWRPPRSWLDAAFEEDLVRVVGTFDNPIFLAEVLGLTLPIVLALLVKRKDFGDKTFLAICTALQGYALILTYSRGAWLGFIASLGLLTVFFDKRLIALGLILALAVSFLAPKILVKRLLSSFSFTDSSNSYRVSIWRGSIDLAKTYLFRGVGLGAESFSQTYPEHMIVQTPAPHAHSLYLETAIEVGVLGFAAFFWFFLLWGTGTLKAIFSQDLKRGERWLRVGFLAGAVASVAGHLLQGLVEYTWYNPRVTAIFWAIVGASAGDAFREKEGTKAA